MMNIEQMRDALSEDEIEHINSLTSRNLFHYVRDMIIARHSDDEVRELYYYTIGEADQDERD
tara:strand:- start:49 stop:234 length:186 start_codon:yes stop_codon:yes gene_type:complete